jgi:hypothetical protein
VVPVAASSPGTCPSPPLRMPITNHDPEHSGEVNWVLNSPVQRALVLRSQLGEARLPNPVKNRGAPNQRPVHLVPFAAVRQCIHRRACACACACGSACEAGEGTPRKQKLNIGRLGERRKLRAWSGPARGRPVFFLMGVLRC